MEINKTQTINGNFRRKNTSYQILNLWKRNTTILDHANIPNLNQQYNSTET